MSDRKIRAEQTTTDEIAGECLALRVRLLSRTITGLYDDIAEFLKL